MGQHCKSPPESIVGNAFHVWPVGHTGLAKDAPLHGEKEDWLPSFEAPGNDVQIPQKEMFWDMGFQHVQHWTNDCEPLLPPLQPIDYSDYSAKKRGSTTKTKNINSNNNYYNCDYSTTVVLL